MLATAVVAVLGLTLANIKVLGDFAWRPGEPLPWAETLGFVAVLLFLSSLGSILSVRVGVPELLGRPLYRQLRRLRIAIGRDWEQSGRCESWRRWLWNRTRKVFCPVYRPPSSSFLLRLPHQDDDLYALATGDSKSAKAAVFASMYGAFLDLQTRTSKDLARLRAGTFLFAIAMVLLVAATAIMLATRVELPDTMLYENLPNDAEAGSYEHAGEHAGEGRPGSDGEVDSGAGFTPVPPDSA